MIVIMIILSIGALSIICVCQILPPLLPTDAPSTLRPAHPGAPRWATPGPTAAAVAVTVQAENIQICIIYAERNIIIITIMLILRMITILTVTIK